MTKQEMLSLLGLNPNYTELELKKAYRKAAKENHPDLHPGDKEKEKRFKDINNAYEELMKKFGGKKKQSSSTFDINILKQDLVSKINAYFVNLEDYLNQSDFKKIIEDLTEDKDNTILSINRAFKASTAQQLCDNFLGTYKFKLKQFKEGYYKDNYIEADEVTENVDFSTSLRIFFDKLVNIKNKYSREGQYIDRIKEVVSLYLNDIRYKTIKNQINARLKQALVSAKNRKYQNLDSLITNLIADVELIISKYEVFSKKVNGIFEELKGLYGADILEVIEESRYNEDFKENLKKIRGISEAEISMVLNILLGSQNSKYASDDVLLKLEKLIKNKKNVKQNGAVINEINKKIFLAFSSTLLGKSAEEQQAIISTYNRYLEFYELALKGDISLDEFKKLEWLTFTDTEKDNKLFYSLGNVNKDQNDINNNLNRIYVKKSNGINKSIPYSKFCFLMDFNEELYMMSVTPDGGVASSKVTKEELSENYVTYDEFMKDMRFDGRVSSYWLKPYVVFYVNSSNEYGIVFNNDEIFIDSLFEYKQRYYTPEFPQYILPFEDKALLKKAILEMFTRKIREFASRNRFDYNKNNVYKTFTDSIAEIEKNINNIDSIPEIKNFEKIKNHKLKI